MDEIYNDFKKRSHYQKIVKIKRMFFLIRIIVSLITYLLFINYKQQITFIIVIIIIIELLIEQIENTIIIKINKLEFTFKLLMISFNNGPDNNILREYKRLDKNLLLDLIVSYKVDEPNKIVFLIDQFQKKNDIYVKLSFISIITTIIGIYSFIVIPNTAEDALNALLGISVIVLIGIFVSKIREYITKKSVNTERFKH